MLKPLIAVHYEENSQGRVFNIIDLEGTIYLRVQTVKKKNADHDLMVREVQEAPSGMRIAVKESLNEFFGEDKWKVISRIPTKATMLLEANMTFREHEKAINLKVDLDSNQIIRTSL